MRTAIVLLALSIATSARAASESTAPADDTAPEHAPMPPLGPDPAVLETLPFDAAIERALERNPTSLAAAAEIRRAQALLEEVRAASIPTLVGTGTYTRLDSNRVSGDTLVEPESAINLAATLSVPLANPRGWVQWQQAGDLVDVARAAAADVRRSLAIATARAYLEVIAQKRLLETAVTARDDAKAHYDFTHAQRAGGIGNSLDEARAAEELTGDEAIVQSRTTALLQAREALGVLVAGDHAVDAADWSPRETPSLTEALADATRLRADVRRRERATQAADRRVDQAYADYLPYLGLVAAPFYQSVPVPTMPETGWQGQLVLTVPLYDGGLREGQEHERQSLADEAHFLVEATLRQATSEVRSAAEEMRRADAALAQARDSAAFAENALRLATLAYRAGATSNLEVIDAERSARDGETQAAIAEDTARQARLDLLAASGRFPGDLRSVPVSK